MTLKPLSFYAYSLFEMGYAVSYACYRIYLSSSPDDEIKGLIKEQNLPRNPAAYATNQPINIINRVNPIPPPVAKKITNAISDIANATNSPFIQPPLPIGPAVRHPMCPVPSLQPNFPNPGVQPHSIPSSTIHVNPHLNPYLPASGSMPAPNPVPVDPVPIGDILIDPLPPGGNPPPAADPGAGSISKWASLLPLISKLAGPILPLIPPLLYEFYNREEKILQNANVNILATRTPKQYTVAFGNKDGEEMSIDFEVVAGKFYRDEVIEANDGFAHTIFKTKTLLSYLPVISRFEWNRKKHETDCNITIDDPGNLSLQKGPISVYYPLSENEGFNIIYRDPTATSAIATSLFNGRTHDYHLNAEDSEYSSFNVASMKVVEPLGRYEKERTQTASLPFDDDPKKAHDYYLKVTQYNPAIE